MAIVNSYVSLQEGIELSQVMEVPRNLSSIWIWLSINQPAIGDPFMDTPIYIWRFHIYWGK